MIYFLFAGIIVSLGALILELTAAAVWGESANLFVLENIPLLMIAAVIAEEILKLAALGKMFSRQPSAPRSSFVSRAFIFGSGFSLGEIGLNLIRQGFWDWKLLPDYSNLILLHAATASLLGLFWIYRKEKGFLIWLLPPASIVLHFLYNLAVARSLGQSYPALFLLALILFIFSLKTPDKPNFLAKQNQVKYNSDES